MSYPPPPAGNNQPQPPYGQPPQGGGYPSPQQPGYPPPQQPGYPPQQPGYPPQQPGYPPQQPGYPRQQGYGPQQGFPGQGFPPQGPRYGGPPQQKSKTGVVILSVVGAMVLILVVAVVVLSRAGVIGGPLAKGVPSVPPPTQFPATVGSGLYLIDGKDPMTYKATNAKYDWVVAKYYSTKPQEQTDGKTPVYIVTVYGPLGNAKDALSTRENVTKVGNGYCADGGTQTPLRICGVNHGSVVATVTDSFGTIGRTASDEQLLSDASALATALS